MLNELGPGITTWKYRTTGDFVVFIPNHALSSFGVISRLRDRIPTQSYSRQVYRGKDCVACPNWHNN